MQYDANKIVYGKDSSEMLRFFSKLSSFLATPEKVREIKIAQIGGSHVQGGFWGDRLTTDFQELKKTQGGGIFAFPFKLAKTNSPPYFTTFSNGVWKSCRTALLKNNCTRVGVSQILLFTNDSASFFGVKMQENAHHKYFNELRVYHNFNPSFSFSIKNGMEAKRIEVPEKGYTLFILKTKTDSVVFELKRKDTLQHDFVLYGFDLQNTAEPGIYYAALGANGASTKTVLRCQLFAEQLKTIQPDLVILSLGVNDLQGADFNKEEYIARYDSLIYRIKKAVPTCAVLFTTPTDNYIRRKTPNKKTALAQECIYTLAQKHQAALWDMYAVMGGYKSIFKWYQAGYARKDRVHFAAKGYALFSDLMFEALMTSYKRNKK